MNIVACDPMGYHEFIYVVKNAGIVVTDSGGIQEETTVLGIPCITLRNNTERPETVTEGTNEMIGDDMRLLADLFQRLRSKEWKKGTIPELWDGRTGERIVDRIINLKISH